MSISFRVNQGEAVVGRRLGALLAVEPRADAAADPDRHGLRGIGQVHAVGIDHLVGMADVAAEPDGEVPARGVVPVATLGDRLGDAEIALALRHLAQLHIDPLGMEEGGIDVPARAGAGMAGNMDARQREALGDVAGDVGPHQMQRNAGAPRPLQRGHAVAHLLEAGAEAALDALNVVARFLAGGEERLIGHDQRRGEIARQRVAGDDGRVRRQVAGLDQLVDLARGGEQAELVGDHEQRRFRRQHFGGDEFMRPRIKAPGDASWQRGGAPVQPEHVGEVALQPVFERIRGEIDVAADALGLGLQRGEVVGVLLDEIGHRIGRGVIAGLAVQRPGAAGAVRLAQRLELVVEPHHRPPDRRVRGGEVAYVLVGQRILGEQLVAEQLHHVADEAGFVVLHQLARLDAEIAGQLHQERHGDPPAIMLDQVEIARRNAERGREVRLRDALGAAQPLHPAADARFGGGEHGPALCWLYKIDL